MKRIIYRSKETGKIVRDGDYEDYLRALRSDEELLDKKIIEYNIKGRLFQAEIVELDDVAEFYAKRAEQRFNIPDDIAERLRDIESYIADIVSEIEAVK